MLHWDKGVGKTGTKKGAKAGQGRGNTGKMEGEGKNDTREGEN